MWALYCFRTAQLLCLVLWGTAATAHELEKRDHFINPECLLGKLNYPRIEPWAFGIKVERIAFNPKKECLENGAKYVVNVTWIVEGDAPRENDVAVEKDSYKIGDLKPWTIVDIYVSLCYIDKAGERHCGKVTDFHTRTSESAPSAPVNFRITEASPSFMTLDFDKPEVPNGHLDGYSYEVCKQKSCEDIVRWRYCGGDENEVRPFYENSFQVKGLAPLEYYTIAVWAYNINYVKKKTIKGESAYLCIRAPPSVVEHIRDFKVTCVTGSSRSFVATWKLPSNSRNTPEGYKLQVFKHSDKQDPMKAERFEHNLKIQSSCKGETCTYRQEDHEGGAFYGVHLSPFYKDVHPLEDFTTRDGCYLPPPPPAKEIKVVNNPALNRTQQEIEIPEDLFSELDTAVERMEFLVSEESQIDDCPRPEAWSVAHAHDPIWCYVAIFGEGEEAMRFCSKTGNVFRCVLGAEEECTGAYICNGALKAGIRYGVKIRATFKYGHIDSKPAFFTAGSPSSAGELASESEHKVPHRTAGTPLSTEEKVTHAQQHDVPPVPADTPPTHEVPPAAADTPPSHEVPPEPADTPVSHEVPPAPADTPPSHEVPPEPADTPLSHEVPPASADTPVSHEVPPEPADTPPSHEVPSSTPRTLPSTSGPGNGVRSGWNVFLISGIVVLIVWM